MDPQFPVAIKDDVWRLQDDMKSIRTAQADHTNRISQLERRLEDDARLRSVWGNSSPFPSILNGTPQQDPGYNPAAEAFKSFDQDHHSSNLGSLHLDTEDEPRRGASRANSVRFDKSALHGQIGHGSRSSSDFFPLRTGSGLGSHPMTERSSSHKSEGRHSSAGPSVRANSLSLEARELSTSVAEPIHSPPPGLFILGPLPSIIRCWLDSNFSNESLLYTGICTGSYKSLLGFALASRLGLLDQTLMDDDGHQTIKLLVSLPEATIQRSARSSSPIPQLPSLTINFTLIHMQPDPRAIQIVLGSDVLRTRNADILFSQSHMTLADDDQNRVVIPLVRPENMATYQNLQTTNMSEGKTIPFTSSSKSRNSQQDTAARAPPTLQTANVLTGSVPMESNTQQMSNLSIASSGPSSPHPSVIGEGRKPAGPRDSNGATPTAQAGNDTINPNYVGETLTPDTPSRSETGNIWGPWRREPTQNGHNESSATTTSSGYQRAGRGRGMKVLKPARSANSSRTASNSQVQAGFVAAPPRFSENLRNGGQPSSGGNVNALQPPASEIKPSLSSEAKSPLHPVTNQPRSANPIGGASAFGWLNPSNQHKQSGGADY